MTASWAASRASRSWISTAAISARSQLRRDSRRTSRTRQAFTPAKLHSSAVQALVSGLPARREGTSGVPAVCLGSQVLSEPPPPGASNGSVVKQGSFCPNRAVKPGTFSSGGVNPGHPLSEQGGSARTARQVTTSHISPLFRRSAGHQTGCPATPLRCRHSKWGRGWRAGPIHSSLNADHLSRFSV
jgi:hypothetical protein